MFLYWFVVFVFCVFERACYTWLSLKPNLDDKTHWSKNISLLHGLLRSIPYVNHQIWQISKHHSSIYHYHLITFHVVTGITQVVQWNQKTIVEKNHITHPILYWFIQFTWHGKTWLSTFRINYAFVSTESTGKYVWALQLKENMNVKSVCCFYKYCFKYKQ